MTTLTIHRASGFQWNGFTSDRTKDVFYRKLRPPLKSWQPTRFYQMPLPMLLPDNQKLPLVHS